MEPVKSVVAKRGSGKIELQAQLEHSGFESFCQVQTRTYLQASDGRGDLGEGANPPPPPPLSSPPCSAGSTAYQAARPRGAMRLARNALGSETLGARRGAARSLDTSGCRPSSPRDLEQKRTRALPPKPGRQLAPRLQ